MHENRHTLNVEESQIHELIMQMYRLASEAVNDSHDCLMSQNTEVAEKIVSKDPELNALMRQVEKECLIAIATQQPVARDLLEIIASMQISTELERIGDHAKSIANIVKGMDPGDYSGPMDQISQMFGLCTDMFGKIIDAYSNRDVELARSCAESDNDIDELNQLASSSLVMQIATSGDQDMHATHMLWIAYHLERIGDRVTNIAERIVFMVTAETPDLG